MKAIENLLSHGLVLVRDLGKPTLLFSATPYRNDFKAFSIAEEDAFTFTFQEAIAGNFIRDVVFSKLANIITLSDFVNSLVTFYDNYIQNFSKPAGVTVPKVIIRCESANDIRDITRSLRKLGKAAIGLHENFRNSRNQFDSVKEAYKQQPNAVFWVHQFKLVEGIDDSSFSILAMYHQFGSERPFIQQIGRIIRNKTLSANQKAYVLYHGNNKAPLIWGKYCSYELTNTSTTSFSTGSLFDKYLQIHPLYDYTDNKFRKRFNIKDNNAHQSLKYKQSTNIYKKAASFNWGNLISQTKLQWVENDFMIKNVITKNQDATTILLYYTQENSSILDDDLFIELKLGFTIIRYIEGNIYYFDTNGLIPDYLRQNAYLIDNENLLFLFKGKSAKISSVSLVNGDLGANATRRKSITADSIQSTSPTLSDYYHFCSSATGMTESGVGGIPIRRYIGLRGSKVTDGARGLNYIEYLLWTQHIHDSLKDSSNQLISLFDRYALSVPAPASPDPVHILIDIDRETRFINSDDAKELKFDEVCYPITNNKFDLLANGESYQTTITYDNSSKVYNLVSDQLDYTFKQSNTTVAHKNEALVKYINNTQCFRVVTKGGAVIYSHSKFYKPRLKINGKAAQSKFNLCNILFTVAALTKCSEKGDVANASASGWEADSLFELVNTLGVGTELGSYLVDTELLICVDLGEEVADFISVDFTNKKVVFMHLKDGGLTNSKTGKVSHRKVSASVFHDVCGQVSKNLHWLHPFSEIDNYNPDGWNNVWSKVPGLARIRKSPSTQNAKYWWDKIRDLIKDPACNREVWIVMSRGLMKGDFERSFNATRPKSEFIQLIYMLQSTWASASSINVGLKVFCSP